MMDAEAPIDRALRWVAEAKGSRVKTGMHRLGVAGALVIGIPGLLMLTFAAALYVEVLLNGGSPFDNTWAISFILGFAFATLAALFYGLCALVSWIICGFTDRRDVAVEHSR